MVIQNKRLTYRFLQNRKKHTEASSFCHLGTAPPNAQYCFDELRFHGTKVNYTEPQSFDFDIKAGLLSRRSVVIISAEVFLQFYLYFFFISSPVVQ